MSETGGCTISDTSEYYDCIIPRTAPYYLPKAVDPGGSLSANRYPWFLCQAAGSKYSVENRANYWWAWLSLPYVGGVWVPVVFLKGGPENGPEPGLPVCDNSGPTSTTAPLATSTGSAPTTTTTPTR